MYETISLKGMEWKVLTEVILEMCGICETKGKRNCMEVCTLLDKTVVTQHNWLIILIMFYMYIATDHYGLYTVGVSFLIIGVGSYIQVSKNKNPEGFME